MIYCPAGRPLWFELARLLAEKGVAEPVLWLGDGVHDAKAKNSFARAEVISFKSINFKRKVPPRVLRRPIRRVLDECRATSNS